MKKIITLLSFVMFVVMAHGNSEIEIPLYKVKKLNFNDSDKSSEPGLLMRQLEYLSTASTEELIEFYKKSPYVKSCSYNELADNYHCKLAKHGKVSSGDVFISTKSRNGLTEVFADYFYFK